MWATSPTGRRGLFAVVFLAAWLVTGLIMVSGLAGWLDLAALPPDFGVLRSSLLLFALNALAGLQAVISGFASRTVLVVTDEGVLLSGPRGWQVPRSEVSGAWGGPDGNRLSLRFTPAVTRGRVAWAIRFSGWFGLGKAERGSLVLSVDRADVDGLRRLIGA
ncbi:MAG: hypothetical protein ACK5LS_11380 [Propioniciclava sp.]